MSFKSKREAQRAANKVLRRLSGNGWTIHVHENIGWHFCLKLGELKLYQDTHTRQFSTLMGSYHGSPGGDSVLLIRDHFINPDEAVRTQLERNRTWLNAVVAVITKTEDLYIGEDYATDQRKIGPLVRRRKQRLRAQT